MMFSRMRRSSDDEGLSLLLVIGFGLVATSLMIVGTTIADRSLVSSRQHPTSKARSPRPRTGSTRR